MDKQRILIIEDNKVLGDLLVKTLASEGYEATLERNGREGMEAIRRISPDLLLLDIVLPEKSGYEILEDMSKEGLIERVPTVIISNSGEPVQISRAMGLGVRDYIVKADFSVDEVLAKVKKGLAAKITDPRVHENITVLLVEDDPFLQNIAGRVLGKNFATRYATSGEAALAEVSSSVPDMIILDIVLPGAMTGLDVLEKLRANHALDRTAILMFTNLSQDEDHKRATELGADSYLVKAEFDIGELEHVVQELVAARRAAHPV